MALLFQQYREWARGVLGKKLASVKGVIYLFDTLDLEYPQQLQFRFSNANNTASFKCGMDGSSLELTDSPLKETDLGEYGKEVIMDMSNLPSFSRVIHKTLEKTYAVFSETDKSYIGLKLLFEAGLELFVLNVGDEINIFEFLPLSYKQEDVTRCLEL